MAAGLSGCERFASLDAEQVDRLLAVVADSCEIAAFEAGDTVFSQGEHTTCLYVLVDGQIQLQRTVQLGDRTARTPIALLGKGRAMGWTSLLYGPHNSTASAICQKPSRVICVNGPVLRSALEADAVIGFRVLERLACMLGERLRAAYTAMETHL
jgi:CRP-like cAMP-binding protein